MSYNISPSLSDWLHSVWQSLGPSMLLQMALFHFFLKTTALSLIFPLLGMCSFPHQWESFKSNANLPSFNKCLLIPASACVLTLSWASIILDTSLGSIHSRQTTLNYSYVALCLSPLPLINLLWAQTYDITHPYIVAGSLIVEWKEGRGKERMEKEVERRKKGKEEGETRKEAQPFCLLLFVG